MVNKLKLSLIIAPLALVLVVVAYVYALWAADRKKANDLPVEAVSTLVRDLLRFHEKTRRFPEDLSKLEGVVWERKTRSFAVNNRALSHRNYYYFYTQISPHCQAPKL